MGHAVRLMGPEHVAGTIEKPTRETDHASMPWPGEELVSRVTGAPDRANFHNSGRQSVRDIEAALALVHRPLESFSTMLDFGCGCGRIMLWLEHLASTSSLHGVDIDARAIAWAQENMPWATFRANQPLPPLEYPDGSFDLVFNHSVFTHIDEHYQDQWLAELRRVTRPGGYLLLSVHGEQAFLVFEEHVGKIGGDASILRQELSSKGIAFIRDDAFTGGPFPDFYHSTFHAPWYVFQHWGRFFTIVGYLPRGSMGFQDFVLLQRPPDDAAVGGGPITVAHGAQAPSPVPGTSPPGAEESALHRAGGLLHVGPKVPIDQRTDRLSRFVRRLLNDELQATQNHQQQVNESLFTALWELDATVKVRTSSGGVPLAELNARLWDALRLQGQRVNRLETDLWEALQSGKHPDHPETNQD